MTKYFPFPLQRGDLPCFNADGTIKESVNEEERYNNLEQNLNLAHLVTVECETKDTKVDVESARLTVKFKYFLHLMFEPNVISYDTIQERDEKRRTKVLDVSDRDSVTVNEAFIERHQRSGEKFVRHYDSVLMQFYDNGGQKVPIKQTVNPSDLSLGGFSPADSKPIGLLTGNCYSYVEYLKYRKDLDLGHLVAYLWQNEGSADDRHLKLSLYWDTSKPFSIPAICPDDRWRSNIASGIFRCNNALQRAMFSQQELITRVEHDIKTASKRLTGVQNEELHRDPVDFNLTLRDYQARTLSWLAKQESNPFVMDICFVKSNDGSKKISIEGTESNNNYPQKIHGGILADETGSGKTLLALALMKQYPMDRRQIPASDLEKYENGNLIVKATLVICPANLVNQWEDEYHKCISNGGRIIKITTIIQARRYTLADIQEADMILMSHSFLANKNFYSQKNLLKVKYLALKYHRIVVDEFHELMHQMYAKNGEIRTSSHVFEIFGDLDAYCKLGLTGTPNFHLSYNVVRAAKILGVYLPNLTGYAELFLRHYVRRSVPDLNLPPVKYEQIDVTLKPVERAIYQSLGNNARAALLLCSHFDMERYEEAKTNETAAVLNDGSGNELLSVNDVALKIQAGRLAAVARETKELEKFQTKRAKMQERQELLSKDDFILIDEQINEVANRIQQLQGDHAFFDNVLQTLKNRSEQECNICLNEFENEDSVALTRCGHIFCQSCIDKSLKLKPVCPICRRKIESNSIYRVAPSGEDQEVKEPVVRAQNSNSNFNCGTSSANPIMIDLSDDEDAENINPNIVARQLDMLPEPSVEPNAEAPIDQHFYGSKITKMVAYINNLFAANAEARVLLFIQFSPLSKMVSRALAFLGIQNSFVSGSIFSRNNAIEKFKQGQVKVIILSAETSVTGLHLTEATHVVLLHPFYSNEGRDRAIAAEKQGVARAYRLGLTHELKVVRFVVKDTIEEEMMRDRPALPI